jgi:hypothetical protein
VEILFVSDFAMKSENFVTWNFSSLVGYAALLSTNLEFHMHFSFNRKTIYLYTHIYIGG